MRVESGKVHATLVHLPLHCVPQHLYMTSHCTRAFYYFLVCKLVTKWHVNIASFFLIGFVVVYIMYVVCKHLALLIGILYILVRNGTNYSIFIICIYLHSLKAGASNTAVASSTYRTF